MRGRGVFLCFVEKSSILHRELVIGEEFLETTRYGNAENATSTENYPKNTGLEYLCKEVVY